MIDRYEILKSRSPRPDAKGILFCDGAGGAWFDPLSDLELSHWRPNRTPEEYLSGTSTEICYRFLDKPRPGDWTVAVNNHVDVDGILSVYCLVHSEHALAHRRAIIQAAEIGDFWGWGEPPAQRLFQGLTLLFDKSEDPQAIYAEAFRRIPGLLSGADPDCEAIDESLAPLRHAEHLLETGAVVRTLLGERLAHYRIPNLTDDDQAAAYVPAFNEAISSKAAFWPQVMAKRDSQRVCLVSTMRNGGWFHDLWFPGYHWADVRNLWTVPGFRFHDDMESYSLENSAVIAAAERIRQLETAAGHWSFGWETGPRGELLKEKFPLVGRFLSANGAPAVSKLSPEQVAATWNDAFG